jgi:hypothetical protein
MRKAPLLAAITLLAACAHAPQRPKNLRDRGPSITDLCRSSSEELRGVLAAPGAPDFCRKVGWIDAAVHVACDKSGGAGDLHDQVELARIRHCAGEELEQSLLEIKCLGSILAMSTALMNADATCELDEAREAQAAMDRACESHKGMASVRDQIAELKRFFREIFETCRGKKKIPQPKPGSGGRITLR